MKILVGDDSKTSLAVITSALNSLGHEVTAVSSGEEVITSYKAKRPDLIILDVMMSPMNGFECAKAIRGIKEEDWIPIIFLSSSVDDQSIEQGINAGGDDYLTKPFSEVTLAAKIKAMQRIAEMRSKLVEVSHELRLLTSTDPLTKVYNRYQFEHALKEKLGETDRHKLNLCLLFIDLDHFKAINDSLGHQVGDKLLIEVAERIKSVLRVEDFIARIGGDEFVVILTHLHDIQEGGEVAQKILNALAPPYTLDGNTIRISSSIGIAGYPHEGLTKETLVQGADIAMYHAKELGRNNFQYYTQELKDQYSQQINLERELKFALERDELFILYQPIVNLLTKRMVSMEALVRWKHPEYGVVSPNIFIPIAEESGQIVSIGSWVMNQVCEQSAKWASQGLEDFKVSVNVSLHQFLQENFYETVNQTLTKTNFPPNRLELELTETTVIAYTSYLKSTIEKLKLKGISISVDDFGTRYSSLTSLKFLPITTLKIDKTFLQDVTSDPKNSIIVKSLIALGSSLNLNVIAEGVEKEEQQQFLIVNGCFYGQGYLIAKPMTVDEMTHYLRSSSKEKSIKT